MKKAFPGDPEFSWNRFYQLPYDYVLSGYYKYQKLRRQELHELELPIALNTAVYANSQRNPKSPKKALEPFDFSFYRPIEENGPKGYYAACYLHAAKKGDLPSWALFCFKEVSGSARGEAGLQYMLVAEDAVLVGPRKIAEGQFKGLLVAKESASNQVRTFLDPDGVSYDLLVPEIETKIVAKEDAILSP